ncbi:hypothetical protein GGR51DRAFT_494544 [Nemania sp. FL0031]|nr:hypothetical protein GGR51DRAFT_494544 [Nemania sp. FL0031]
MNSGEHVLSWIQSLPGLEAGPENNVVSTPERRRLEGSDGGSEIDATTRAFAGNIPSLSDTDSVISVESGGLGRSGTSPLKKIALLRRAGEMEIRPLDVKSLPQVAGSNSLFESIDAIGHGVNVLPYRMKSTIEKEMADSGGRSFSLWGEAFQSFEESDDLPGCIPSFEEVNDIVEWARLCQVDGCEEAGWNSAVNMALLRKVFGGAKQNINAMLCTTARPSKYFKPAYSTGQLIDICIYKSVGQDEVLIDKINRFSANFRTSNSINHTDYNPLRTRLLLLSIKTERPRTSNKKAQLQIGVWYSTQWSFLQWAVGQRLKRANPKDTTAEVEAATLASLSKLGFIPGIIVRGDEWCIVFSTYDGTKTTLWEEYRFGTTATGLGTFCAVGVIRRLAAWMNDHYWPWFKENVLD